MKIVCLSGVPCPRCLKRQTTTSGESSQCHSPIAYILAPSPESPAPVAISIAFAPAPFLHTLARHCSSWSSLGPALAPVPHTEDTIRPNDCSAVHDRHIPRSQCMLVLYCRSNFMDIYTAWYHSRVIWPTTLQFRAWYDHPYYWLSVPSREYHRRYQNQYSC